MKLSVAINLLEIRGILAHVIVPAMKRSRRPFQFRREDKEIEENLELIEKVKYLYFVATNLHDP